MSGAQASLLADGKRLHLNHGPIDLIVEAFGHPAEIQKLESTYLQCLSFAALPMLVMAAVNGFFSGRGQTWIVLAKPALPPPNPDVS